MKLRKSNLNKIKSNKLVLLLVVLLFSLFIYRICYLCLVDYKVGDKTITAFIKNRNIEEDIILPSRGSIYDKDGNSLAHDVASYNVIAYLDPSRSENSEKQMHVSDIDMTATKLAPYINMEVSDLKKILSKKAYQVELGIGSRNLTQLQKEEIEALNLPGIGFEESTKRYYPNGKFASYLLGYTVNKQDDYGNDWKVGELGLESYFNDTLSGKAGKITYERDRYGYKIANGREYKEEAQNGDDVYLTIDSNIQLFVENALEKTINDSKAELALMLVADARTGAILAYGSNPSFDPNIKDITSYVDPIVSYAYEPGSVMKVFSYMCDIENNLYNGNATYTSGSMTYEDASGEKTTIKDWNKAGWGNITYDKGFALSSNIAVANLVKNGLNKKILHACYNDYGFGETLGFPLYGEASGNIDFNYEIEVATAGYGQGINTTAIQIVQGLTAITNNGELLRPYIVDKIVDTDTKEITYEGQREAIKTVASEDTIDKMKNLMESVICDDKANCTGNAYYMEDYPMIGKTGTAQIWDDKTNGYMTGSSDYIYSFAGIYPKDNPELIVYMAVKKPKDTTNYIAPAVKDVVVNTSKYMNIDATNTDTKKIKIDSYLNKPIDEVKKELEKNGIRVISLGTNGKIINQYPSKNNILYNGDNIILVSNDYDNTMIDLTGLSYKDVNKLLKMININYKLEGTGYVYEQSIAPGTKFNSNDTINIKLKEKYID